MPEHILPELPKNVIDFTKRLQQKANEQTQTQLELQLRLNPTNLIPNLTYGWDLPLVAGRIPRTDPFLDVIDRLEAAAISTGLVEYDKAEGVQDASKKIQVDNWHIPVDTQFQPTMVYIISSHDEAAEHIEMVSQPISHNTFVEKLPLATGVHLVKPNGDTSFHIDQPTSVLVNEEVDPHGRMWDIITKGAAGKVDRIVNCRIAPAPGIPLLPRNRNNRLQ